MRCRNFILTLVNRCFRVRRYINVVTLFTSSPALSVVFFSFVCFVVVVCLVLLSLVAAAFLANKDVCITNILPSPGI